MQLLMYLKTYFARVKFVQNERYTLSSKEATTSRFKDHIPCCETQHPATDNISDHLLSPIWLNFRGTICMSLNNNCFFCFNTARSSKH